MSSQLAIGVASAVLCRLLSDALVAAASAVGPAWVTATAPDMIRLDDVDARPGVNLFMVRVEAHDIPGPGLPRHGVDVPLDPPPLALDLHYLLTAYGVSDFQAEILLGHAMSALHREPVLDAATIRAALDQGPIDPSAPSMALQALAAAGVAEQIGPLAVTLMPWDMQEMSQLWSAIRAPYRPSAAYVVSTVVI